MLSSPSAFAIYGMQQLAVRCRMEGETRNDQYAIVAKVILALLPPLLFLGFGAVLIAIGVSSYRKTTITQTWPSTEGTVSATNIRRYNDEGTIRFAPEIDYEYQVAGQTYRSSEIRPEVFVSFSDEDEAKRFLRKYAVGSKPQVFYDPATPTRAVIEPRAAPVLHLVTMMGVISCTFALAVYYASYRRFRRRRLRAKH
ncbi:MAG TPA: DUF3592 domain-containing protein [Pyrinomonadaceae bacterium]|nr:DUF3592 domain-containing protein [Pyrinomonadaceae bacterium]